MENARLSLRCLEVCAVLEEALRIVFRAGRTLLLPLVPPRLLMDGCLLFRLLRVRERGC